MTFLILAGGVLWYTGFKFIGNELQPLDAAEVMFEGLHQAGRFRDSLETYHSYASVKLS